MELVLKAAAAGIVAALAAALVRRHNPELAVATAAAGCAVVLAVALDVGEAVMDLIRTVRSLSGLSSAVLTPVVKCVGIGIAARLGADTCRDAGSAGLASAVELAGAAAALFTALPLFTTLLGMLEDMT